MSCPAYKKFEMFKYFLLHVYASKKYTLFSTNFSYIISQENINSKNFRHLNR